MYVIPLVNVKVNWGPENYSRLLITLVFLECELENWKRTS